MDDETKAHFAKIEGMLEEQRAHDERLSEKDASTANAMRALESRVIELEQRPHSGDERIAIVRVEGSRPITEIVIRYVEGEVPK